MGFLPEKQDTFVRRSQFQELQLGLAYYLANRLRKHYQPAKRRNGLKGNEAVRPRRLTVMVPRQGIFIRVSVTGGSVRQSSRSFG